jgi:hypothetical protein
MTRSRRVARLELPQIRDSIIDEIISELKRFRAPNFLDIPGTPMAA